MDRNKYIQILQALSKNVNPATGEVLENDSPINNEDTKKTLKLAVKCIEKIDGKTENSGVSWTDEEEKELVKDLKSDLSYYAIARKHGRTLNAIERREDKLFKKGLLVPEDIKHRSKNY
ncbi:MAG: hypothetical protein ACOCP8_08405 [archaeon]